MVDFIKIFTSKIILLSSIISLGMAFVSCGGRPRHVLSEDKMVSLMVDMEITEAYVNSQMSSGNKDRVEIGRQVLAKHGVTPEQLDTTLAWYGRNVDKYSALFDKVDKEINKRRLKYTKTPETTLKLSDNLWPYTPHLVMSSFGGYENFTFSFPVTDLAKGNLLKFSYHLPNPTPLKVTFGVEYTDGSGEATVSNFSTKSKSEMMLQTDTSKTVARIYGILNPKEVKVFPLYIDSIALKEEPRDSLDYRTKRRMQKSYGVFPKPMKIEIKEKKDTVLANSPSLADSLFRKEETPDVFETSNHGIRPNRNRNNHRRLQ